MRPYSEQCSIRLVKNIDEFAELKPVWNKLVAAGHYDFTVSWEWMFSWWEVYHDGRELYVLSFSVHDTIVAIFPLQRVFLRHYGIKRKIIQFLGAGENERDETCSEYLDLIVSPQYREQVIDVFLDYMQNRKADWDVIQLSDMRKSAANYPVLLASNSTMKMVCRQAQVKAPYIALPDSWDELLKVTRINAREQLNRKNKLIAKEGKIEFRRYSGLNISESIFQCFIDLHQKRWQGTGKPGCFSSLLFTDFHKKLLAQCANDNAVIIYLLLVDNKAIAARYCFEFGQKIYDYQTGLDTTFDSRSSPGTVLLAHVIKDSITRGKTRYEFFKGKKGSYKYKWTDKDEILVTVLLTGKKIKNTLFQLVDGFMRFIRGFKQRVTKA